MDKIPKCQIPKQVRNDSRVFAFTLAEVLITLVIIGVIAALTIPNLLQKYQEQTTVKKVQKFYSNLSNAYSLAIKDNGPANEWGMAGDWSTQDTEKIYEILFKPYFKIAKNCGAYNSGQCITNANYKTLNNLDANSTVSTYGTNRGYYKIALDDGAAVWWRGDSNTPINAAIFYDVNGKKEPNQWGKDLFAFAIKNDKVFPHGIQSGTYSQYPFNSNCQKTNQGYGCAAWVVYKGNMDYLHCDGLTWNSRSCKDK